MKNTAEVSAIVTFSLGIVLAIVTTISAVDHGKSNGRVKGLLESGRYEIVTNYDYSVKELETFLKINNVYLKEIE